MELLSHSSTRLLSPLKQCVDNLSLLSLSQRGARCLLVSLISSRERGLVGFQSQYYLLYYLLIGKFSPKQKKLFNFKIGEGFALYAINNYKMTSRVPYMNNSKDTDLQ